MKERRMHYRQMNWPKRPCTAALMTAFLFSYMTGAEAAEQKETAGSPQASSDEAANAKTPGKMPQWQLPNAAAAAALGEGDGSATSPATMRQLHLQILTRGEATGFAVESSPYLIDNILSFEDYQSDYWNRALARVQLSGALVDEQKGPAKAALGVKWTAFNLSDPYNDRRLYNADAAKIVRDKGAAATDADIAATGCLGELLLKADLGKPG